ncbi:ATP-dependent Clp protease proteolytic subunit [[Flavobacterium] thermophilum]|nr:ATP-dependent Clp protease proteolytic subunit [[Flavobacterium] thermophilum]
MEKVKKSKLWDIEFETISSTPPLIDYVQYELLEDRRIYLTSDIGSDTIEYVNTLIEKFNYEDEKNSINPEEAKPIRLYINSYGGSIYDGLSIVNTILTSKTKVIGICTGYAMSMGLGIYVACHERWAMPYTNFMYHELSSSASGRAEEIKRATQEYERLQKMYDHILTSRTSLSQKKLNTVKKSANDWFFDVYEAKKYGVVHKIIGVD